MKSAYLILNTLNNICSGNSNRSEVNQLIELAHNYACTYLKYRYKNLGKVLLAEDVTIKELGIDAVAPLFERDENGMFVRIIKAFKEWNPKIENEEQAQFFVNRMVAKSVEKYVSETLRKSDPFFSKILGSLNYIIEKNGYCKKNILGTIYIVENKHYKCIGNLPDNSFIKNLPLNLFKSNKDILSEIFDYLKNNTNNSIAIPLNALVLKIKEVNASSFIIKDSISDNELEIDSIIENALRNTFIKLQESYLNRNKIDEVEAELMKKALRLIAEDMQDGGINPGLHKYLMEQMVELSFEDYQNKYQNIFEYLFKVLKKSIVVQLK